MRCSARMLAATGPAAVIILLGLVGCGLPSLTIFRRAESEPPPAPPAPYTMFSGEHAWRHLEALAAIGPRVTGTAGADEARAYIRGELEAIGLTVREHVYDVGEEAARAQAAEEAQAGGAAPAPTGAEAGSAAPEAAGAPTSASGPSSPPDTETGAQTDTQRDTVADTETDRDAAESGGAPTPGAADGVAPEGGAAASDAAPVPAGDPAEALRALRSLTPEQLRALAQMGGGEADAEPRGSRVIHLTAVVPGQSPDVFLLAAHFDTAPFGAFRHVGANDGGSGPALLLELARVLAEHPLPYTTWITFLDGEEPFAPGVPAHLGSNLLAEELAESGGLDRVRLGVFFNQVADADLRIARDLRSSRRYREVFFGAARRLGYTDAFPSQSSLDSPDGSHLAFVSKRVQRLVAIVDNQFGGTEAPGLYWHTEDDTIERCSADSLGAVGAVTLAALDEIGQMLWKIDRFVGAARAAAPTAAL